MSAVKTKVLFFSDWSELVGGGPISLLHLVKGLDRDRFEPVVICPDSGTLHKALQDLDIKTRIIKVAKIIGPGLFSLPVNLIKLLSFIDTEGVEVIHSNAAASRETIYAGLAARLKGLPFIYHVRISHPVGMIERFIFKLAAKVVVISDAVGNNIAPFVGKDRIVKVFNGVDIHLFRPDSGKGTLREEYGVGPDTIIVGTIGRLNLDKGHEVFLQACLLSKKQVSKVKFVIVGGDITRDRKYERYLQDRAAGLGLSSDVIFTGHCDDIRGTLADFDIFVHSCSNEAFGRVIIEAMAMGKVVISIDANGPREIVLHKKTGVLVPPDSPEAMSRAIVDLLKNPQKRIDMGKRGRERAEEVFALEKHVSALEDIYREVLQEK